MRTFTLDTNCIIALDEKRSEAAAVQTLVDAHASGKANVAIVAISASEKQMGGGHLENFVEFQQRLVLLGLDQLGKRGTNQISQIHRRSANFLLV